MNQIDFKDEKISINNKNLKFPENTDNISESFEKIKKELLDEKNILLNFLDEKTITDIKHNNWRCYYSKCR